MTDFINQETVNELKIRFAKHLLKYPTEPFKAAAFIFPDNKDIGNRLIAAHDWPKCPIVILEIDRLIDNNEQETILPTKDQIAYEVYLVGKASFEAEDKLKAYKLYAEMQGFVKTPGVSINNTVNNKQTHISDSNVMLVPIHENDDDWQKTLAEQQQKLLAIDIEAPLNANSTIPGTISRQ